MMHHLRLLAFVLGMFIFGARFAACLAGCATPPATAARVAAEGAYGAALLDCVEKSSTLAESKACRARVDAAWGITQTGKDGGR